jgi:pyruvate kinase
MALNLQWGVIPLLVDLADDMEANISKTIDLMRANGMVKEGEAVLVVSDLTAAHATSTTFQSIQVKIIV